MLDPMEEAKLSYAVRRWYPHGPCLGGSPVGQTRELVGTVVNVLTYALRQSGSPVRVDLELDPKKSGPTAVRALIIYTGRSTLTVPMTISPSCLVRINEKPIYLGHENGASDLLKAIQSEIAAAIEADNKADS